MTHKKTFTAIPNLLAKGRTPKNVPVQQYRCTGFVEKPL
jgi:hypothetical protein